MGFLYNFIYVLFLNKDILSYLQINKKNINYASFVEILRFFLSFVAFLFSLT